VESHGGWLEKSSGLTPSVFVTLPSEKKDHLDAFQKAFGAFDVVEVLNGHDSVGVTLHQIVETLNASKKKRTPVRKVA
jgi:hypothetical protein